MTDKQKNYARVMEIEKRNKERILELCPKAMDRSGIYCFFRMGEDGLKYAYVGKSITVLTRLASHLNGYDSHIDKSIRSHGLFDPYDHPCGYKVIVLQYCEPSQLDEWERYYIKQWADRGYQMRNVESGGTTGKTDINERKPARGYRDGVKQGERNVIKKMAHWFDKHLKVGYKADKPSKNAIKALEQFNQLLQGESEE